MTWPRPIPLIGDTSSAAERSSQPDGWAVPDATRQALYDVIAARRDVRRFRPDPVAPEVLTRVLEAAHAAPSVGHSQPWRFIIVSEEATRERAAWMADQERLAQAAQLTPSAGQHLLDLQLEGIREAPLGIVVCCDRRTEPTGVLGRATFVDADLWSCACAIENLWLAARAEGLGLGWVTLFQPDALASLLAVPADVTPLGWLCLGWPDERPPSPGLERAGWSQRQPLSDVVIWERWPASDGANHEPAPPVSKLRSPGPQAVVGAHDDADTLLTAPGSLGVLDRALDRIVALGHGHLTGGTLVLVGGRHPVVDFGVSAFAATVTDDVLAAAAVGEALGAVAAGAAGLTLDVVDAGTSTGNLVDTNALDPERVALLIEIGRRRGALAGRTGLVALGEVGIGNTTVAAALTAAILGLEADAVVGLGAGADTAIVARKREVVAAALRRSRALHGDELRTPVVALACVGGPEFAALVGVTLGAVEMGAVVVLDGLATSVAALAAALIEPAVVAHLIGGQRSREAAHGAVLDRLGLEPLLDLRFRAGEGVGACLATGLLLNGLQMRRRAARTR